jgi:hypothetical protein
LLPQIQQLGLPQSDLGETTTLPARLFAELSAIRGGVAGMDLVGGWSQVSSAV